MDSKLNMRNLALAVVAVAVSGAAFYVGDGLSPRWWVVWLAALPVLWMAPRLPWATAGIAALVARAIGGLSLWDYLGNLRFPLWLKLEVLLPPAVVFGAAVLLFRIFLRRERPWLALLAFPSLLVGYEYLNSLASGTFGTTAYTQLRNLPVLQLGALAGLWGISFAVLLFAPTLAAIILSRAERRPRLIVAGVVFYTCVFVYGGWRLWYTPAAPHSTTVGLVESDLAKNMLPQNDADAMRLMRDYAVQVKALANHGANIVVIPEMTALVRDSISGGVDHLFEETARSAHVQVVVGVLHVSSTAAFNEARLYSQSGALVAVYRKHHLVPVLEGRTTPGHGIVVVPESIGTVGLEICRDMDYRYPARRYGKADVGLLLVPAWDFDVDRVWHGHMAIMRGIENGFSIVRTAKHGFLTVSDDRGRILAETRTSPQENFTAMIATVPVRHDWTLYQSWGDWFAWLDLALVAGILIMLFRLPQAAIRSELATATELGAATKVSA